MSLINLIDQEIKNIQISEQLQYHIDNNHSITESIFRLESQAYDNLLIETRYLYEVGLIELKTENDKFIFERLQTGKRGIYKGKSVVLDKPQRSEKKNKSWKVYRYTGKKDKDGKMKAKVIHWGDPDMPIRNGDKEAAKSFRARHKCSEKTDKDTAGWWACYAPKYFSEVMNLSSNSVW